MGLLSRLYLFIFISFFPRLVFAQDMEETSNYKREFYAGLNMNTNGGVLAGATFKYSVKSKKKEGLYNSIYLEIVNVKHPKEVRVSTSNNQNNSSYILGKTNYLLPIRLMYGKEYVLFKKAKDEGVHLNGIIALGPTFGIVKPYLLQYGDSLGAAKPTQYYTTMQEQKIYGGSGFFSGFDMAELKMGIALKAGLSFEFGDSAGMSGVELGFLFEGYTEKIYLMPDDAAKNKQFFSSAYAVIFFGGRK